jgi:hypothetical protein
MKKLFILAVAMLAGLAGFSQQPAASNITVNWNFAAPLSSDFVKGLQGYGGNIGYNQSIGKGLTAGLEVGWNTSYKYYPRQTNDTKDGAFTTDMYKSLYTLPVTLNVTKYFTLGNILSPYVKVGAGTLYSEQHQYYNIYEEDNSNWGFTLIPELGLHIKTNPTAKWAFNVGAQYRYATNAVTNYHISNLQSVNFNGGISWMLR